MFKKIGDFFTRIKQAFANFLFKNRYGTIMLLVGGIVAFWDLILKFLSDGKSLPAINGIFNIYSTHNTGGAWSIFSNSTIFLIVVTIIFIVAIIIFNYNLNKKNYFYAISMGLLLSGAVCNLFDRIKYGYVRDFINLEFINFPVFNIADIAITVGVILLVIYFLFIMPKVDEIKLVEPDETAVLFVNNYQITKLEIVENNNEEKIVKKANNSKKTSKNSNITKKSNKTKNTNKSKAKNVE